MSAKIIPIRGVNPTSRTVGACVDVAGCAIHHSVRCWFAEHAGGGPNEGDRAEMYNYAAFLLEEGAHSMHRLAAEAERLSARELGRQ